MSFEINFQKSDLMSLRVYLVKSTDKLQLLPDKYVGD